MPRVPAAVLWDMDGTLVDTEPYWIAAEHELVTEYGGQWSPQLGHQLVGNPLLVSAEIILSHTPMPLTPRQVVDRLMGQVLIHVREEVPWRPGARELLHSIHEHGIPNALVTMSWRPLTDAVVASLAEGTFAAVVTGEEVREGKPHPEPFLTAARLLGARPEDCIAIEDSDKGIAAAVAAGVPTIAAPYTVPVPPIPGSVVVDTLEGLDLAALVALAGSCAYRPEGQSSGW